MAAPDFAVTGGDPLPAVEPFGLLDSLPEEVLAAAREWERHVVEVETGLPPDAEPGTAPRPEYDPQARTLAAARPGQGRRARRRACRTVRPDARPLRPAGPVGPGRSARGAGVGGDRAGRRAAGRGGRQVIDAETDASTGTRSRLIRRVTKAVEDDLRAGCGAAAGPDDVLQADRRAGRRAAHVRLGGDAPADREPAGAAVHPDVRRAAG